VGTLFGIAKDHGFRFPDVDGDAPAPDPAALAAAAAERERKRLAEEAEYRRRADDAARWARELWADASEAGSSPYLNRKGVQAHGVRCLPDGTLLVPMRNAAGELQNVQRIAPVKPASDQPGQQPEKRFLPGGRKSGLWHLIGELRSRERTTERQARRRQDVAVVRWAVRRGRRWAARAGRVGARGSQGWRAAQALLGGQIRP
jgi:putative DNA primase/helicase